MDEAPKYTPQALKDLAKQLADDADWLAALAEQVESHGFESLSPTNADQMRRALGYTNNFAGAVREALRQARMERGDFGAFPPIEKEPAKRIKKK